MADNNKKLNFDATHQSALNDALKMAKENDMYDGLMSPEEAIMILLKDEKNLDSLIKELRNSYPNLTDEEVGKLIQGEGDVYTKNQKQVEHNILNAALECAKREEFLGTKVSGNYNTSAWLNHSLNVARCAADIAEMLGLDRNDLMTLGLLHDIGRKKTHSFDHVLEGFYLLHDMGHTKEAMGCLLHSFIKGSRFCNLERPFDSFSITSDGHESLGEADKGEDVNCILAEYRKAFFNGIKQIMESDLDTKEGKIRLYNLILNIADLMATAEKIVSPLERVEDIISRREKDSNSPNQSAQPNTGANNKNGTNLHNNTNSPVSQSDTDTNNNAEKKSNSLPNKNLFIAEYTNILNELLSLIQPDIEIKKTCSALDGLDNLMEAFKQASAQFSNVRDLKVKQLEQQRIHTGSMYGKLAIESLTKYNGFPVEEAIDYINNNRECDVHREAGIYQSVRAGMKYITKVSGLPRNDLDEFVYRNNKESSQFIKNWRGVVENGKFVSDSDKIEFYNLALNTMMAIHNSWVEDPNNHHKFLDRDKKFQHMPSELIGFKELLKDFDYAKDIFSAVGVDSLDKNLLEKMYNEHVKNFLLNAYDKNLGMENSLIKQISKNPKKFYPSLDGYDEASLKFMQDPENAKKILESIKQNGIGDPHDVLIELIAKEEYSTKYAEALRKLSKKDKELVKSMRKKLLEEHKIQVKSGDKNTAENSNIRRRTYRKDNR